MSLKLVEESIVFRNEHWFSTVFYQNFDNPSLKNIIAPVIAILRCLMFIFWLNDNTMMFENSLDNYDFGNACCLC